MFVYKFSCGYVFFISLEYIPRVELRGHVVTLCCLIFSGIARLFSKVASSDYIPNQHCMRVPMLFSVSYNNHPNGCEMVSHCGFDLYFPSD